MKLEQQKASNNSSQTEFTRLKPTQTREEKRKLLIAALERSGLSVKASKGKSNPQIYRPWGEGVSG